MPQSIPHENSPIRLLSLGYLRGISLVCQSRKRISSIINHLLLWPGLLGQNRRILESFLFENPSIRTTETRFHEPARLSTPPKPLFSLKPLDATTWLRFNSAERELKDSRRAEMFQSYIRMSRSCFRMPRGCLGISSRYLEIIMRKYYFWKKWRINNYYFWLAQGLNRLTCDPSDQIRDYKLRD